MNTYFCASIFRVHPETKVYALRDEIEQQLGADLVPREFVFLKSVGRSLTRVSSLLTFFFPMYQGIDCHSPVAVVQLTLKNFNIYYISVMTSNSLQLLTRELI